MNDALPAGKAVDEFFDCLTDDYTATIERCFPRYREMLWAAIDYLPADLVVRNILELGSGTGNLSMLLAEKFPEATIHLVDVSGESMAACRSRFGNDTRIQYHRQDFRELQFDAGQFDLVASSIAVHHLDSTEKQTLFANILRWLNRQGIFVYADQHAGATGDLYQRHIDHWKAAAIGAGSTQQEWDMWMQHQAEHDHHDTLTDQIDWLRTAGFDVVDCPWRYLLWTVLQARKRAAST